MLNSNAEKLLTDKSIIQLSEKYGLIKPLDKTKLSGCSCDLRAGAVLRSRNRAMSFDLRGKEYVIESGECVTIQTLEEVNLRTPLIYGLIINKHSVLARGLFHPITSIDPGFVGKLAITFFNLGNTRFAMKRGDVICNVCFYSLELEPDRIYGVTQSPSYKEGSTEIALIVDHPHETENDTALAQMYGKPIERLYGRLKELEDKYAIGDLTREQARRRRRGEKYWDVLKIVLSALAGAVVTKNWDSISLFLKTIF